MVTRYDDGTVEFAFFRPTASSVGLAGEFNQWKPERQPLQRGDDGWWRVRLALPPGEYRFKYLVNESFWEADFAAYGVENDKKFGWTSLVWVPAAAPSMRNAA